MTEVVADLDGILGVNTYAYKCTDQSAMKQYLASKCLRTAQYYTTTRKMPCKGGLDSNAIEIM